MNAALSSPPHRRRARKGCKAKAPARAVLIAGAEQALAGRLGEAFAEMGLEHVWAADYEATLLRLQERPFALWVLDAAPLRLMESIVWASLRFAAEGPLGGSDLLTQSHECARAPVILLAHPGQNLAYRALNAAATAPSITGWNRKGWILGVQDLPFVKEDLMALTKELLAEAEVGAAKPAGS
ncbi:MAG: hypothetical protein HY291_07040 [Planctomycetes bacterium]|nr:hypothetical protein [Planctomycetota bacterium]